MIVGTVRSVMMRSRWLAGAIVLVVVLAGTYANVVSAQAATPRSVIVGPTDFKHRGSGVSIVHDAPYTKAVRITLSPKSWGLYENKTDSFLRAHRGKRVKVCVRARNNGISGGFDVVSAALRGSHEFTSRRTTWTTSCFTTSVVKTLGAPETYKEIDISTDGVWAGVPRRDWFERLSLTAV